MVSHRLDLMFKHAVLGIHLTCLGCLSVSDSESVGFVSC